MAPLGPAGELQALLDRGLSGRSFATDAEPSEQSATDESADPSALGRAAEVGEPANEQSDTGTETDDLSDDEKREVEELKARDREVRTHEQAHIAASGSLTTAGPFYEFETGPDGKRYVVGGEVKIQAPEGRDPDETIRIQEQLIRAALAPVEPSSQDRRVAAGARQKIAEAKLEKAEVEREGEPSERGALGGEPQDAPDENESNSTVDSAPTSARLEAPASNRLAIARYVSVAAA